MPIPAADFPTLNPDDCCSDRDCNS